MDADGDSDAFEKGFDEAKKEVNEGVRCYSISFEGAKKEVNEGVRCYLLFHTDFIR
jgi:hypothetical protein